jgi:glutathione S-transferase
VSEIVLYQYGGAGGVPSFSPPCLKVNLALRRLGVAHRVVDLASPMAVKRRSPTGRVPVISVDGETIADSVFILDRLSLKHPDASLWPKDAAQRAIDRLWDCFATDTLYWQGFYLRWLVPETRKRVLDATMGAGFSLKKALMGPLAAWLLRGRARGQGIGGRSQKDVEESYRTSLGMIDVGLGTGPFLQSRSEPGRGDLAVAAHVAQFAVGRSEATLARLREGHPRLLAHVAASFEACGLPPP